jgi:hypothetical protein
LHQQTTILKEVDRRRLDYENGKRKKVQLRKMVQHRAHMLKQERKFAQVIKSASLILVMQSFLFAVMIACMHAANRVHALPITNAVMIARNKICIGMKVLLLFIYSGIPTSA